MPWDLTMQVADTSVIICGGVIIEDVYGGGFGVSENSVIGNTSVTVSGRTITYIFWVADMMVLSAEQLA